jgi:hypothetical protein
LAGCKEKKDKGLGWLWKGFRGGWRLDSEIVGAEERLFTGVSKLQIRIETLRAES